jgi:hypothetical protein
MASDQEKRQRLIEFLDKTVFDPVLKADQDKYDADKRDKLADVKRSTANERRRFHDDYPSAVAVKQTICPTSAHRWRRERTRNSKNWDCRACIRYATTL